MAGGTLDPSQKEQDITRRTLEGRCPDERERKRYVHLERLL